MNSSMLRMTWTYGRVQTGGHLGCSPFIGHLCIPRTDIYDTCFPSSVIFENAWEGSSSISQGIVQHWADLREGFMLNVYAIHLKLHLTRLMGSKRKKALDVRDLSPRSKNVVLAIYANMFSILQFSLHICFALQIQSSQSVMLRANRLEASSTTNPQVCLRAELTYRC